MGDVRLGATVTSLASLASLARGSRMPTPAEGREDVAERSELRAMIGFVVTGVAAYVEIAAREGLHQLEAERVSPLNVLGRAAE